MAENNLNVEDIEYDGQRLVDVVHKYGGQYLAIHSIDGRQTVGIDYDTTQAGAGREYFTRMATTSREINVELSLKAQSYGEVREIVDGLSSALYRTDDVPIRFGDEPDMTYYGRYTGVSDDGEPTNMAQMTLTFLCLDRLKYGKENTYTISDNFSVANEGTAEALPVFNLEATQDITLLSVENKDNLREDGSERSVTLGTESEADEETVDTKKLVLHDTMQSTSGWTKASDVDSGDVSGSMTSDDKGFYADKWGDEDSQADDGYSNDNNLGTWVGPSLKRELDTPISDSFTVEALIENNNEYNPDGSPAGETATGLIEIYFRDVNDNKIAKISFGDSFGNQAKNGAAFEKGRVDVTGEKRFSLRNRGWNDFDGQLRVKRDTDDFIVEVARIENGVHTNKETLRSRPIAESGTLDTHPIKSIQVAMRKYNGSQRMINRLKELRVYDSVGEFDDLLDDDVTPIEIKKGDKIKIDGENSRVLLNGENAPRLHNLDSEFFTLVEGINDLKVSGPVSGTVSFRNRYL